MPRRAKQKVEWDPPHSEDFMWLVGILEGEGCFYWDIWTGRPAIKLHMTDRDVVKRAAVLLEGDLLGPHQKKERKKDGSLRKLTWGVEFRSNAAAYRMNILLPYMGDRRQGQIMNCLTRWIDKGHLLTVAV